MRIQELAAHLDISIGTVSRALNGKPDVNPQTRARVLEAAQRLGYAPNQSGRSLRKGKTGTVAFVMEVAPHNSDESAAFFMLVHQGVQSVLVPEGLDYIVLMCPAEADPAAFMARVVGRRLADGYILSATKRIDPRIDLLERRELPFVSLGRSLSGGAYEWIDLDFAGIARRSVDLLVAGGHRRIAVTVPSDDANLGHIHLEGYRDALAAHGLRPDEDWIIRAPTHGGGGHVVTQAILRSARRPTAVLLVNDLMAEGLYAGLREAGIEPGRDIAVTGQRQIPQNAHLRPSLTSYRMSVFEIGQALGIRLLRRFGLGKPSPSLPAFDGNLWPYELQLGESHLALRAVQPPSPPEPPPFGS